MCAPRPAAALTPLAALVAAALGGACEPEPHAEPVPAPAPAEAPAAAPKAAREAPTLARAPALAPRAPAPGSETCPPRAPAGPLPAVTPADRQLETWLRRLAAEPETDPDAVLLTADEVAAHRAALRAHHPAVVSLTEPFDRPAFARELRDRLAFLEGMHRDGTYVRPAGAREARGDPAGWPAAAALDATLDAVLAQGPKLHIAANPLPVLCSPSRGAWLKRPSEGGDPDPRFDRNACSTVRVGEALQVLGPWPGDAQLALVRTRYTFGWVPRDRLDEESIGPPRRPDRVAAARPAPRALTRRAALTAAFERLGRPYGWGGSGGGLDCSRFVMDTFESVGLGLPRASADQRDAGTFSVDLTQPGVASTERERLALLDLAHDHGVVLLGFPGHVMLYLGRDDAGRPMVIHAFAEYVEPCPGGGETLREHASVAVSGLELGRGSSRRALLERITRLTVLGRPPGPALLGVAQLRDGLAPATPPADACGQGELATVVLSPRRPNASQPLRVMVTRRAPHAPRALVLHGPGGRRLEPPLRRFGGPPYTYVATLEAPTAGEWTATFGDGDLVDACKRFRVRSRPAPVRADCRDPDALPVGEHDPVWRPRDAWGKRTEALFAGWVEALFDYPLDEDLTWPNLTVLLEDPSRNLLHDHMSRREDAQLKLRPDCADLPYFLRGYFAWKMGLPFGYRKCSRGRPGRPPACGELFTQAMPCEGQRGDDLKGVQRFLRRKVGGGVHSASSRTAPGADATDYYPVPLTRDALRPGRVFSDPYGHVMIVARWVAQGPGGEGALIAADAQPDGTIGRRRFWRGSFLFTPDTDDVGAGFKAFRPVRWRGADNVWAVGNEDLARGHKGFTPWSDAQYALSEDGFYDAMDALIHPRPLDPFDKQGQLVTAFGEQVTRRVVSVQNGEDYKARGVPTIPMPDGARIFQTSGPWEDFSTPSRDMRLLIAMDTVLRFADRVRRAPERYAVEAGEVDRVVARLEAERDAALSDVKVTYVRSDGSPWTLSLREVLDRAEAFEMAWNPNDCVERRWAAPEGSDELTTCRARAPSAQRRKMARYRPWFTDRKRPAW